MKKYRVLILAVIFVLCLAACSGTGNTVETETDVPEQPPQISEYVTMEQVATATAITVAKVEQFRDGSAGYFSEDGAQAVYVSAQKMTAAEFDAMYTQLAAGTSLTDAPNLAQKAFWYEDVCALTAFTGSYALEIRVEYAIPDANTALLAARQLAVVLMEKISL